MHHQKKILKLLFGSRWHACAKDKPRSYKTSQTWKEKSNLISTIFTKFTTLNQSFEEPNWELHDARCKVDEIESSVQNNDVQFGEMCERLLFLERYLRQ